MKISGVWKGAIAYITLTLLVCLNLFDVNFSAFIKDNEHVFTVIFSFVVTLSTVVYAVLTRSLVKETVKLRHAETEPALSVYIKPHDKKIFIFILVIQNHGRGAAKNLTWKFENDMEDFKKRNIDIESVAIFQGLSYLAPGQRIETLFGTSTGLLDNGGIKPFIIHCSYKNTNDEQREQTFFLNPAEYLGLMRVSEDIEEVTIQPPLGL